MNPIIKISFIMLFVLSIVSCAITEEPKKEPSKENYQVQKSFLSRKQINDVPSAERISQVEASNNPNVNEGKVLKLPALKHPELKLRQTEALSVSFSNVPTLSVSVNEMPVVDFLHYVFGELLNINYIIDKDITQVEQTITLNIKDKISAQRLMQLTVELLIENNLEVKFNEDVYLIHQLTKNNQNIVTSIGRELSSVPKTAQEILQIVPLQYGIKIAIERTLRQLVRVKITPDFEQSALFLQGKRGDILRAMEFIHLLDAPANRGKHIGLIPLTYINSDDFTKQISLLLENEGIPVAVNKAQNKNLVLVPITQIGAIAVFATQENMLNRVRFWAKTIDQPIKSLTKQYFMYHPQYARASDLGESLSALLGGAKSAASTKASNTSSQNQNTSISNNRDNNTGAAPSNKRTTGISNENITLVVDERSNALIFYTSGNEYQAILPLIKSLDVLPRQVMLDITVAEVTLQDEFKHGVEWALSQSEVSASTKGSFGVPSIGGFSVAINGIDGELQANFFQTNSLVKVLSNPSLLVRDGVAANINVGSQISVVGQTSENPLDGDSRQTTTSEYITTGVNVNVTPSINARGIVIMDINQKISNSVPDSVGAGGNPNIFERALKTEVVAQSGQTIILGGLISENINNNDKKTPWLADIPVIGQLFKSKGDSVNRTELVMLITPKVIDRTEQWQEITESFKQNLEFLAISTQKNNN